VWFEHLSVKNIVFSYTTLCSDIYIYIYIYVCVCVCVCVCVSNPRGSLLDPSSNQRGKGGSMFPLPNYMRYQPRLQKLLNDRCWKFVQNVSNSYGVKRKLDKFTGICSVVLSALMPRDLREKIVLL